MKLNLGSGRDFHQPGFLNVDMRREHSNVQADARALPFKSESVEEILSLHLVEHVPMVELDPMLKEWVRVMKKGAKISIECPDFDGTVRQYLSTPEGPARYRLLRIVYGFQPVDFHYNGLNQHRLAQAMRQAGLGNIRKGAPIRRIFGPSEPLLRLEGVKS